MCFWSILANLAWLFFFMVTFISIKIVHDSLLYPLDIKLLEGCIFLLERSDVTDIEFCLSLLVDQTTVR